MRGTTFAAAVFLFGVQVHATTIYNDGGTHTVSAPSGPITVTNATTLNIQTGANITGAGTPGVDVYSGSVINLSGGTVTGGVGFAAIQLNGSTFNATGGVAMGPDGVDDYGAGPVNISGGTFTGERGLNMITSNLGVTITISGGTFQGGNDPTFLEGQGAYIALLSATDALTISGGHFIAGSTDSLYLFEGVAGAAATVSGGTYVGPIAMVLSIGSTATFHGTNLNYVNGLLTGTLADGSSISSQVLLEENSTAIVSVTPGGIQFTGVAAATPAPTSLLMMSLGLAAVAGMAWRRRLAA